MDTRFRYVVDDPYSDAVDIHHVEVRKSSNGRFFNAAVFLAAASSVAFHLPTMVNERLIPQSLYWVFLFTAIFILKWVRPKVVKESVVIMPAFGIQLETHYTRGRTNRRFIPMHKILKPVLAECLTPMTCYWTLSLLMHGREEELILVFKDLRPPVGILVPVWKALCAAATDTCR
ncbi:uncharacterized protein LOC124910560 [Impatiens glandulifera]|uniref:uncharacterized protein LOC124910560 n=1 Tax=Impatiens glandulifera TaxID=253017 RepID=UPI001FB0B0D6|nr:uncharacterized protein LOC124910560 [Impatiens glandulifera]